MTLISKYPAKRKVTNNQAPLRSLRACLLPEQKNGNLHRAH